MNKYLLMISCLLVGCGGWTPDDVVEVDAEVINSALSAVEDQWSLRFGKIDIDQILTIYPVDIYYVEEIPPLADGTKLRGLYTSSAILVTWWEEKDWDSCMQLRYVLAHEILHHLSIVLGHANSETNQSHMVKGVFMSVEDDQDWSLTVEWKAYMQLSSLCKMKYPKE